jgi:hypothetical protein
MGVAAHCRATPTIPDINLSCALAAASAVTASMARRMSVMSDHEQLNEQDQEAWPQKARRHNVSTRTLDRWAEAGIIAKPIRINKRKYGPRNEQPREDVAD